MNLHTQDWETVILKKPPQPVVHDGKTKKPPQDGDEFNIPKIPSELKKAIQQARLASKCSQKDLATKLNVPVKTIIEYENGKAIPNNNFILKLEKCLNTKLPRVKKNKKKIVD